MPHAGGLQENVRQALETLHFRRSYPGGLLLFHRLPEHRRKYLAMLMYGFTAIQAMEKKTPHYIIMGSWPVGTENIANKNASIKMGGVKDRSHIILELKL